MLYKPDIQSGCLIKEEFTQGDIKWFGKSLYVQKYIHQKLMIIQKYLITSMLLTA